MFTIGLYILALALLVISFVHDRNKTRLSVVKAWQSFESVLPQLLAIFIVIGIVQAILSPAAISQLIGPQSGWLGIWLASIIGSIILIPAVVAFPLAATLLQSGAGYMQIAVFVSTLMMVGIVTLPLEIRYFGRKAALTRNLLAYGFSFIVALAIGAVVI